MSNAATAHLRKKYKDRMLQTAFVASGWSPMQEGERQGCVLAFDGKYIVSVGFNGHDRDWKPKHDCGGTCCTVAAAPVVHAEINALINLRETEGPEPGRCVAYVTKRPCRACFQALRNAGVSAIFWLQDCSGEECYWEKGGADPKRFGTYA